MYKPPPSDSTSKGHIFSETMQTVLFGHEKSNHDGVKQHNYIENKAKSDSSNIACAPLIESPTDVLPTISPGESGYDSTEFGSVASDTLSQQSLSHDVLPTSEQSTPTIRPKNAQAALAGTKYQRIFSFESSRTTPETSHSKSGKNSKNCANVFNKVATD